MNVIWNETRIRDEIKRLDQKTGLRGKIFRLCLAMQNTR